MKTVLHATCCGLVGMLAVIDMGGCAASAPSASNSTSESTSRTVSQEMDAYRAPATMPRIWLVAAGVSTYQDERFRLNYADADAKAIGDIFAAPAGSVSATRSYVLLNDKATRESVLDALQEVASRSAQDDIIVVFMAMHGISNPQEPFYFMAHDTKPNKLLATGISDDDVKKALSRANAKQIVMLLDVCHAGGFGLDSQFRAVRAEKTRQLLLDLNSVRGGTGILAAASQLEYSEEDARWGGGHGVFTYHLVNGLKQGAADENQDGVVTLRELFDYVYDRVKKDRRGEQHPTIMGHDRIPLMIHRAAPTRRVEEHPPTATSTTATSTSPTKPAPTVSAAPAQSIDAPKSLPPTAPAMSSGVVVREAKLPSGTFVMGERGDTVTVASFYLDLTEVTVDAYARCVQVNVCTKPKTNEFCNWGRSDRDNHPINCVNWHQARAYCAWAGRRLPTEEEWEWAARGASRGTTYPWGNDPPAGQLCWAGKGNKRGNGSPRSTCAVGSHPEGHSPQGVNDLAGNVQEWVEGTFGKDERYGVTRGGHWVAELDSSMRVAARHIDTRDMDSITVGFRCARTPE